MTIGGDAYRSLPATAEVASLRDRHLDFFRTFARRARDAELGRERDTWIGLLEGELDNLRAALAWSLEIRDPEAAMDLAASCLRLWERGRYSEGRIWLGRALAIDGTPTAERVSALLAAAYLARYDERDALTTEAVDNARGISEPGLLATALAWRGVEHHTRGRVEEAFAALREVIAVDDRSLLGRAAQAHALRALGRLGLEVNGDLAGARDLYEQAGRALAAANLEGARIVHLGNHANFAWEVGDLVTAERLYDEKLRLESESGLMASRADTLLNLADVRQSLLRRDEARALLHEVVTLGDQSRDNGNRLRAYVRLAYLDFLEADLESAASRLEVAQEVVDSTQDALDEFPNNLPLVHYLRSRLAQHRGDIVEAERLLQLYVATRSRPLAKARSLVPLAHLASRCGDAVRAQSILREANELLQQEPEEIRVRSELPGLLAEEEGDLDRAWELYEAGGAQRHDRLLPMDLATASAGMARLALRRGDFASVRARVAEGVPAARAVGYSDEIELWWCLARAELLDGNGDAAAEALTHVLPRWPEVGGNPTNWIELLETIATAAVAGARARRGAELLGLADAERERIVFPRAADSGSEVEAAEDAARAELGDDEFERARGRGRAMDIRTELWKEAGR